MLRLNIISKLLFELTFPATLSMKLNFFPFRTFLTSFSNLNNKDKIIIYLNVLKKNKLKKNLLSLITVKTLNFKILFFIFKRN